MALLMHTLDQVRACGDKIADDEEGGVGVVFLQGVQDRRGISVLIAAVEGQVDYLFIGIFRIVCIIFFQFAESGVGDRRLPFFLEA